MRRGDAAPTKLCSCERLVAAEKGTAVLVSPCSALSTFLGKEERHRVGRSSTESLTSEAIDTRPAICDAVVPSPGGPL